MKFINLFSRKHESREALAVDKSVVTGQLSKRSPPSTKGRRCNRFSKTVPILA